MPLEVTIKIDCDMCGIELGTFEGDYLPREGELEDDYGFRCDDCEWKLKNEQKDEWEISQGY